jgi:hypothetical protein
MFYDFMLSKKEFTDRLTTLPKVVYSKTRTAAYIKFKLEGNILYFTRVIPETGWSLDIDVLYDVYSSNKFINTSVIRNITNGRVNSPSVAILMSINCIDIKGNRIN